MEYNRLESAENVSLEERLARTAINVPESPLVAAGPQHSLWKSWIGQRLVSEIFNKPAFVVGCGRSGTTALVASLGQHRRITAHPKGFESPLIQRVGMVAHQYYDAFNSYFVRRTTRISEADFRHHLQILCFESLWGPNVGLHHFRRLPRTNRMQLKGLSHWVAKIWPDENQASGLLHLYPEAKFIYIHRHGAEVVGSMFKYGGGFARYDFEGLCDLWSESVRKYRYLMQHAAAIVIRQENLMRQPSCEFARIWKHLRLEEDPIPAEFASTRVINSVEHTTFLGNVNTYVQQKRKYGDWTDEQKTCFKARCQAALEELGYEMPF